jgi:hypothetical protein
VLKCGDASGGVQERRPSDRISAAAALNSKWFRDEGLLDTFAAGVDDALLGGGSEWQSWLLNNMAKNGQCFKPRLALAWPLMPKPLHADAPDSGLACWSEACGGKDCEGFHTRGLTSAFSA